MFICVGVERTGVRDDQVFNRVLFKKLMKYDGYNTSRWNVRSERTSLNL